MSTDTINIALSKGRILEDFLPLLSKIGIQPTEDIFKSRKLIMPTNNPNVKLLVLRPTDVPAYVEYGAADAGIVGKDVLLEQNDKSLYELLDLNIAKCRLVTAKLMGVEIVNIKRMKVATKFVNIAKRFFSEKGIQVELIKLYGSMELAPMVGLADMIVDLVDTGKTLKSNGLIAVDVIHNISSRFVANPSAYKIKHSKLKPLVQSLATIINNSAQKTLPVSTVDTARNG